MVDTQSLTLSDGRTLCYSTFGSPTDRELPTIFYFHGLPGSHHEGQPIHEAVADRGIRVVAVSRPGFGGSAFKSNRTLLSFADDVLELADHVHAPRFAILGMSGGGPYVLACLQAIPSSRLVGAVAVASMYPTELGLAGMMLPNRVVFALAPWATTVVSYLLDWATGGSIARDDAHPDKFVEVMGNGVKSWPVEDQEALNADDGRLLKVLAKSVQEGIRQGSWGYAWEARLFGSDWGFRLEDLKVETGNLFIYHGAKDINIPSAMAEKAAALIPEAELRVYADEAHISVLAHKMDDITKTLVDMLQRK